MWPNSIHITNCLVKHPNRKWLQKENTNAITRYTKVFFLLATSAETHNIPDTDNGGVEYKYMKWNINHCWTYLSCHYDMPQQNPQKGSAIGYFARDRRRSAKCPENDVNHRVYHIKKLQIHTLHISILVNNFFSFTVTLFIYVYVRVCVNACDYCIAFI